MQNQIQRLEDNLSRNNQKFNEFEQKRLADFQQARETQNNAYLTQLSDHRESTQGLITYLEEAAANAAQPLRVTAASTATEAY